MAFNDNKVCRGCGRMGVSRHTCPSCPCNYCKKPGHIADNCKKPKGPRQSSPHIGSSAGLNSVAGGPLSNPFSPGRRHLQYSPQKDTSLSPKRKASSEPDNARKKSITSTIYRGLNRLPIPTGNRHPDGANVSPILDPEIVQLGCVSMPLLELEPLAVHILGKICSDECPAHVKQYRKQIVEYGGTQKVLTEMMTAIDPQFRDLQGKEVTLEALREIQRNQALDEFLWDAEGGYLDYITDTRSSFYFRLYIGQATILAERIATHLTKMASGNMSTLHYYVKAIGGMYREANFLRVFHVPDSDTNQEDRNLVKTLELEMCVALRTLPQEEVVQWLPQGDLDVKFPSVHLNIANPLVQGSFISTDARQCSRSILLDSVDPEVRQWPSIRDRQLAAKPARSKDFVPSVPLSAYAPIFDDAIKGNTQILGELQPFNSELKIPCDEDFLHGGSLKDYEDAISEYFGRETPLVSPSGSLQSRIAIILDGVESSRSSDQSTSSQTADQVLPYGLREMGLNAGNSLIWPFNLRQSGMFRPDEMSTEAIATKAAYFQEYSQSLIAASGARFILICDGGGQRYMFNQALGLSPPIEITLRGYNISLRLMLDGTQILRVFVVIPDPKKMIRGGDWRSTQKFGQIIRLATVLTKMEAIDYNFFENNRSCASIFQAVASEKTSGMPLTIDLLDSGVRQWLARKGFQTNEDIEALIKLAGSLADGLFVLLCCLPRRPYGSGRPRLRKKRVVKGPKYSKDLFNAVKKLRLEKVRKNFGYLDLPEDDLDKVPDLARISVSRHSSYLGDDGEGGPKDRDDEPEDDLEESNDESTSIMEISLNTTDELEIDIAEVHDMVASQQQRKSNRGGRSLTTFRNRLMRKLYIGGSFNLHKITGKEQFAIPVLRNTLYIYVPTWIGLDHKRGATVKAELAESVTGHAETKIFAQNDTASETARRLAISVSVYQKSGSEVQFWAKRRSAKVAKDVHDFVEEFEKFEAVQVEQATE